jgi:hypothetical protein
MTTALTVERPEPAPSRPGTQAPARSVPPARPPEVAWPATRHDRQETLARLTRPPFVLANWVSQGGRRLGLGLLLDWLEAQPGATWQDRWLASGADADGSGWRQRLATWLGEHGYDTQHRRDVTGRAMLVLISADVIRPSLGWLITATFRRGALVGDIATCRDPEGFARLRALCEADPSVPPAMTSRTLYRAAQLLAAKGGSLREITIGDVTELLAVEAALRGTGIGGTHLFYRTLRTLGIFGDQAPATLRELRSSGQLTCEELIDRYRLACRPIRDLLVDYLRERQAALDYTSLVSLANFLGKLFWADLERHHPGIDSLHLLPEAADAWKQRLRTVPKTIRTPDGCRAEIQIPRINYRECLTPVRAFYLDLAQWAVEDPARWGPWVAPCPVGAEEVSRRKQLRHRKARMDARTRERLPVLPVLVRTANQRRIDTAQLVQPPATPRPAR